MKDFIDFVSPLVHNQPFWYTCLTVAAALVVFAGYKWFEAYWTRRGELAAEKNAPAPNPAKSASGDRSVAAGIITGPVTTGDNSPIVNQQHQTVHGGQFQPAGNMTIGTYVGTITVASSQPAASPSPLHQLPAPPVDFTGRSKELSELRTAIKTNNVAISGLKGMGGIGKTALALRLAEELAHSYPDAQIYLDLLGTATTPLPPAKAMEHVIRSFHPESKLPEDPAQLSALYCSVLSDKRVLLLMDNARDSKQVEPLIPPRGCFLFVTSRQHVELPGLHVTRLDTLPPKDAEDLLVAICPRIADGACALAKACGYLPLALRLAASALNKHETVSVDSHLSRISDAATRTKELAEPALATSYGLLPDDRKRLWRHLSVFPSTFDSTAAAAVWEVGLETAEDLLGDLVSSSLVEWNPQTRRAHLHDLARDFAASHLAENSKEERSARLRHAAHYAKVIRAADDSYDEGGDNVLKGLTLFDLERVNIDTGFKWACGGLDSNDAAGICNDYCAVWSVLDLRQHPRRERIPWLESALAASRRLSDRRSEGNHLGNLGIVYADLGDARKAIEYHKEALVIASVVSHN